MHDKITRRLTLHLVLCLAVKGAVWATPTPTADYRFPSRTQTREEFVKEFMVTLLPGVIERERFIDWRGIERRLKSLEPALAILKEIAEGKSGTLVSRMVEKLIAVTDPAEVLSAAFLLLGHSENSLVTSRDSIDREAISKRIKDGDKAAAQQVAELLVSLGLDRVLSLPDLHAAATGVLLGLETHRRKNAGGKAFINIVRDLLNDVHKRLQAQGINMSLVEEFSVPYSDGTGQKRLDFAILMNDKPRIGIEANFYTTTGSKPSEIKRSYADVRRRLAASGVALVWITDGRGYASMQRSLGDAYLIHPNTYNLRMAREHWVKDFASYLRQ